MPASRAEIVNAAGQCGEIQTMALSGAVMASAAADRPPTSVPTAAAEPAPPS